MNTPPRGVSAASLPTLAAVTTPVRSLWRRRRANAADIAALASQRRPP
ncbi:hypothetical protein [Sorangium sp. So ce426]